MGDKIDFSKVKPTGIQLGENKRPSAQCPKCKGMFEVDIRPFQKDITKPLQDKCPKCGTTIYICILVLMNTNLTLLYGAIQACVEATNPQTLHKV